MSVHQDTDGDVDANDKWYHFAYDDAWRIVATFREDDVNPKEQFVYHNAGLDGRGSSSYIDSVILRDKDASTGWTSQADALDEVRYYCQNWRADVSAIVTSGGYMVEWIKYSPYGIPFGLPGGDTDSDGDCDATDIAQIQSWIDASSYDVRGDLDLDGGSSVDATDKSIAQSNYQGTTSGWNDLTAVGNRKGYAGYEWDGTVSMYHVRHRVLHNVLGRWTRRDPLGFVDGMNVYEYVEGRPIRVLDPAGLGGDPGEYKWTEWPHWAWWHASRSPSFTWAPKDSSYLDPPIYNYAELPKQLFGDQRADDGREFSNTFGHPNCEPGARHEHIYNYKIKLDKHAGLAWHWWAATYDCPCSDYPINFDLDDVVIWNDDPYVDYTFIMEIVGKSDLEFCIIVKYTVQATYRKFGPWRGSLESHVAPALPNQGDLTIDDRSGGRLKNTIALRFCCDAVPPE